MVISLLQIGKSDNYEEDRFERTKSGRKSRLFKKPSER